MDGCTLVAGSEWVLRCCSPSFLLWLPPPPAPSLLPLLAPAGPDPPFPRSASLTPADGLTLLLPSQLQLRLKLQIIPNWWRTYLLTIPDFVLTNNPPSGRCPMPPYEGAPPRDVVQHRCVCWWDDGLGGRLPRFDGARYGGIWWARAQLTIH